MSTDAFQRRDSGMLYEVTGETDDSVTLCAYDEGHTVETVTREVFAAHFDLTQRAAIVAVTHDQDETLTGDDAVVYVLDPQCARFERAAYSETPAAGCWTTQP